MIKTRMFNLKVHYFTALAVFGSVIFVIMYYFYNDFTRIYCVPIALIASAISLFVHLLIYFLSYSRVMVDSSGIRIIKGKKVYEIKWENVKKIHYVHNWNTIEPHCIDVWYLDDGKNKRLFYVYLCSRIIMKRKTYQELFKIIPEYYLKNIEMTVFEE